MAEPFRDRGGETTRIEAFVDAAFAFALTLLVISFDEIPASYDELVLALKSVPAFLASFAIVTMFWLAHRTWSKRYGLDSTFSTLASLALVFVILVYVYPLRTMMAAAFSRITGGWAPSTFEIASADDARMFFVIYGAGFVMCCLLVAVLNIHAYRQRTMLGLSSLETHIAVSEYLAWIIVGGVGLLSMLLAIALPERLIPLAGWAYGVLPFVMWGFSVMRARSAPG